MTDIQEALSYNPETGDITWKVANSKRVAVGSVAGTYDVELDHVRVQFNGRRYRGHRLAWFLHHGEWPEHGVKHLDGNKQNNRLINLELNLSR